MAKLSILAGATSQTINVFVQNSASTTGAGLTGLVYNSSGLTAYYVFPQAASAAIALATLAAVTSAWGTGGFKEIDSTNCPGLYRLDVPNAVIAAASGRFVTLYLQGAANMAPCLLEIELTGWNNQDGVHGGLSALPNTAVTTNASLLTSGTGTDQLEVASGRVDLGKLLGTAISTPATAGILDVNVKNIVNTAAAVDGNNYLKVDLVDIAGSAVSATTAQLGVNVVQLNAQTVTAAAGVTFPASVASPTNITAGTITTVTTTTTATNLTNAPTAGDFTAAMKTSLNAATPASVQNISAQTGDSYARLGAPAGASVSADIAALKTDLDGGVNVTKVNGTSQTARDLGASVLVAGDFSTLMKTSLNASTPASIQNIASQSGDAYARLGAPAGASVSADIAAAKADLDGGVLVSSAGADAILDRTNGVETSFTLRQAQRLMLSALAGKVSGAATTTVTIRDVNDSVNRIVATCDASGDRTAITYSD